MANMRGFEIANGTSNKSSARSAGTQSRRNRAVLDLVLELHRGGCDDAAIATFTDALRAISDTDVARTSLIPKEVSPAFRRRALAIVTEAHPEDLDAWWMRGLEASDALERVHAFETVVTLSRERLERFPSDEHGTSYLAKGACQLEMAWLETRSGAARVDAFLAHAKRFEGGKSVEVWRRAGAHAEEIGRWDVVELASAKVRALTKGESGDVRRRTVRPNAS